MSEYKFLVNPTNVSTWLEENKAAFLPPICNKLMFKGRELSVMFVGGPNQRTDFHYEEGSEFFFQLHGKAEVVTMQQNKRKPVTIHANEMFLLPSRVPHSPQRFANSMGLVIERSRLHGELDRMSWYDDFQKCEKVAFEKYFVCTDLGKDLVPIVQEYNQFTKQGKIRREATNISSSNNDCPHQVPEPISLNRLRKESTSTVAAWNVFHGSMERGDLKFHPDNEFEALLIRSSVNIIAKRNNEEIFLYQLNGNTGGLLRTGQCCVLEMKEKGDVLAIQSNDAELLLVRVKDFFGNKNTWQPVSSSSKL